MSKNAQTTVHLHSSCTSKVMLKILQARLQQYMNQELPDVQAAFRKDRGTSHNVVHWRREWQTTSVFLPGEPHEQYEKAKR